MGWFWLVAFGPSQRPPPWSSSPSNARRNSATEHRDLSSCARRTKGTAGDSNLAQPRLLTSQRRDILLMLSQVPALEHPQFGANDLKLFRKGSFRLPRP